LVNYRVDPDVLSKLLPEPFRPKLVHGVGIAGVCLIRLKHIRPRFVPALFGISSENAAHRIAVTWKQDGKLQEGVYIPRRDTSSWLNTLVGGRLFPGVHYHARFKVCEQDNDYHVVLDSDDGQTHLAVEGHVDSQWPTASSFGSLREASDFFEHGSLGYSSTSRQGKLDGLELRTLQWRVQPLAVRRVESSFFEDRKLFPADSVEFDCALLMRGIDHEWHGRPSLNGSTA
jgi:hypothetical protein